METSLELTNSNKYYQTVIPIESFDVREVRKSQKLFDSYKRQKIIIDGNKDRVHQGREVPPIKKQELRIQ